MKPTASPGKNLFIICSMLGWLIVGASLIYLFPFVTHLVLPSDRTALWMDTLGRSGYNPMLAIAGGGITFVVIVSATLIWNERVES